MPIDNQLRKRIRNDLLQLVDNTLTDKSAGPKIKGLLEDTGISIDELRREVLAYTLAKGLDEYKNEQYRKIVAKITLHFHNLVKGTYHQKRHGLVLSFLNKVRPKHLMDIGYGVPGPYLIPYLQSNQEATATLADQDPSAEEVARKIISNEAPELLRRVKFAVYNMDTQEYPGDADVYLFLDSIEHTKNPTEYLKMIVKKSRAGTYFIFSIPICKMRDLEGFHYDEWLNDEDARKWLRNAGLKIVEEGLAFPNPAVDYFAELTEGGYHNILILAQS